MRKDLRVIKTRENVQSHFLSLLNHYSFQYITVNMLVSECKINRSTFYRNYENKYDLLNQITEELLMKYQKTIQPEVIIVSAGRLESLRVSLMPLMGFFCEYRDALLSLNRDYITAGIFEKMLQIMGQSFLEQLKSHYHIEESQIKTASYYSGLIASSILTTMKWWHLECQESSKEEILNILIGFISKDILSNMKELFGK